MPMQCLRELPALKWKLMNPAKLKKINAKRFAAQQQLLADRFYQVGGLTE
jgi:hypothetical protein